MLKASLAQAKYDHRTLLAEYSAELSHKQEIVALKKSLTRATDSEISLMREVEALKTALTHALTSEQEMRVSARQTRATDPETSQMREVEALKTTLTHALTSEREMRVSARQTREEWERVERGLREEIDELGHDLGRMRKELKGRRMVPLIQRVLGRMRKGLKGRKMVPLIQRVWTCGHEVDTPGGSQQNADRRSVTF